MDTVTTVAWLDIRDGACLRTQLIVEGSRNGSFNIMLS
jgi:hypothetical protein